MTLIIGETVTNENGEEIVVEDATVMCTHGGVAKLKVLGNDFATVGTKLIATYKDPSSVDLQPPGFVICKKDPLSPKPCKLVAVAATNLYEDLTVEGEVTLTPKTTLTCANGTTNCITIIDSGQNSIPLAPKQEKAKKDKKQSEPQTQAQLVELLWKDEKDQEIEDFPHNGKAKIWAKVENPQPNEVLEIFLNLNSKHQKTFELPVDSSGIVEKVINFREYYKEDPEQVRFSVIAYLSKNLDSTLDKRLDPIDYKGYWADEEGNKIEKIEFGKKVRFYFEDFYDYPALLSAFIYEDEKLKVPLVEDKISNLIPTYYDKGEKYFEIQIKDIKDYPQLTKLDKLALRCEVKDGGGWVKKSILALEKMEKPEPAKWHDPVKNPQRTYFNSNAFEKPQNGAYGDVRHNNDGSKKYHSGLDLFALPGTPVYACLDGKVKLTDGPEGGLAIRLKVNVKDLLAQEKEVNYKLEFETEKEEMGEDIKENDKAYLIYMHLSKRVEKLKDGDEVKAGDLIGYTGVTGSTANGKPNPHLHLEIATVENPALIGNGGGRAKRTNPARFVKLKPLSKADIEIQREAAKFDYYINCKKVERSKK